MANEYLKRTPTSTGNRKVWTLSLWLKRNAVFGDTGADAIFNAANTASNSHGTDIRFRKDNSSGNNNGWNFYDYNANAFTWVKYGDAERRDSGNWFHAMFVFDSTKPRGDDRVEVYINGVLDTAIMSSYDTNPSQNYETYVNSITEHYLGVDQFAGSLTTSYSKSQFSDVFLVDGQALTPDVFGFYKDGKGYVSVGSTQATDFRPGQWSPHSPRKIKTEIERKGGFGVNGFYLPMNDSSNFGADFHCTPNSIIKLKGEDLPQPRNGAPTTSDAYVGELRTDPYASSIVLAIPGIAGGQGSGYGDYSADIKGSGSNKTITATGDAGISATALYYGSALNFPGGSTSSLATPSNSDFAFGTGDFTVEFWVKASTQHSYHQIFDTRGTVGNSTTGFSIGYTSGNFYIYTNTFNIQRSVSLDQFVHIAAEREGSNLTLYINGVAVGVQNNFNLNLTNSIIYIGATGTGDTTQYFKGQVQDLRVYKGVAKYKGGFDVPKPFTPVGIESWRQVSDTCKNNFATLNPIDNNSGVISNGNLTYGDDGSNGWNNSRATIGASSGKWYWEMRPDEINQVICASVAGPAGNDTTNGARLGFLPGQSDDAGVTYYDDGKLYHADNQNTGGAWGAAYFEGDIIGIALDMDDSGGKVWFSRNGSWQVSGNPSTGSNPARSNLKTYADTWFPISGTYFANTTQTFNFGQNPTFGNIAALNKNRINSSTADSVWHQSSNTGTHTDWTVSSGGTELDVAVPSGHYARVKLRSADGTIDLKKTYLLSFKYTTGPANLGVQNDQGYMTAVDGSVSPNGLSSGNFYSFVVHGSSVITITGFTGSTYALDNVIVSEIDECYTDDSGKGKFHYQPPTGYLALCEDNLPTPTIADPGEHFKTMLWTGDGNPGRSVRGLGFKPDLVWIKRRNGASDHMLQDSVRGFGPTTKLASSSTQHENDTNSGGSYGITDPQWGYLTSADEDGFSLSDTGTADQVNYSGSPYVAWCWKAGGAAVSNTDGGITAQVSANQTAGFSIVSWTGNGSNGATLGHGLGKRPSWVLVKDRDNSRAWYVWVDDLTGSTVNNGMTLNTSAAVAGFGHGHFTSLNNSTMTLTQGGSSLNNHNQNNTDYIAYCWAEIEGFSKFGSYVGNASADGTFIYCGFKPAFVITKRTDGTSNWLIHDSSRDSVNPVMGALYTNSADAEGSAVRVDFVSNGFKHRNADGGTANNYANNYIFMAFAESPFQTANAK